MKTFRFFGILPLFLFVVSCSDTNAIYSEIPVNDAVDAPPTSGQFQKHVLIEDYTGTWCGNCTRVAYGIEQVVAKTERAVVVAIHNGNDPYHFAGFEPLKDLISPNSDLELPQVRLNRISKWTQPDTNTQTPVNLTSNNCGLGLAMTSSVENGNINLDVNVKFAQNYENLRLVVYVLENHLIYRQTNYSNYYNAQHYVMDFEHNHVLRSSLTNLLGDPITGTDFGKVVSKNFSIPIPANVANSENLSFVAIITDAENNALNSRAAYANETQAFEENP